MNVPTPSLVAPVLDELGIQDILVYKQFHIYSTTKGGSVVDDKYFLLELRKYDGVRRVSGLRMKHVVSVKNPTLIPIPH